MGTSARAQMMLIRLADLWGDAWRWTLMAAGTVLGAYFLLDRGVQNGVLTAAVIGVLVIGTVLSFSKPMAIALMAMPVLFISGARRSRRRRPVGLGRRARGGVRNRGAARTPSLQPPHAGDAHAQSRLSVRHAVHGHRQPLRGEHDRVVPCVAADLRRTRRRMVGRAGRVRAAGAQPHGRGGAGDRGRHVRHGAAPVRRRRLRGGLPVVAVADAQELRRHGDGLHGDHGVRESRLGRLDEARANAGVLDAARRRSS